MTDIVGEDWIVYEDQDVYDGWILRVNSKDGEIKWRDFWVVHKMTKAQKDKIEKQVKELLK